MSLSMVLFCGGRGAASIVTALIKDPGISLTLAVNGYDNGLSTGMLRRMVPGLLGPSDFRKNLSRHAEMSASDGSEILSAFARRLSRNEPLLDLEDLTRELDAAEEEDSCGKRDLARSLRADLSAAVTALDPLDENLRDCSIGNLFMAGRYLRRQCNFNVMLAEVEAMFGAPFRIQNVSDGMNVFLVALKADGELLLDEADIVRPQSEAPITDLFLVRDVEALRDLLSYRRATWGAVRAACRELMIHPPVGDELLVALRRADLVVIAPGTQHSSILPSFLGAGIGKMMAELSCPIVQVLNIAPDHDTVGLSSAQVAHELGRYLDPAALTHVVVDRGRDWIRTAHQTWPVGVEVIADKVESLAAPGTHDGTRTVDMLYSVAGFRPSRR